MQIDQRAIAIRHRRLEECNNIRAHTRSCFPRHSQDSSCALPLSQTCATRRCAPADPPVTPLGDFAFVSDASHCCASGRMGVGIGTMRVTYAVGSASKVARSFCNAEFDWPAKTVVNPITANMDVLIFMSILLSEGTSITKRNGARKNEVRAPGLPGKALN